MRPDSMDLRERIAAAVEHHEGSIRRIARTFRVRTSFRVRRLQRRRGARTLAPEPHRGGPPPALGPGDQERLADLSREQPDATLGQLRQQGGFACSLKTLWLALRRRLTRKKKSRHARQRDRSDVPKKRRWFRRQVRRIEPKRLVFVDETGVTTAMTPASAGAPRGARAVGSAPGSWETVTVIAALGWDGGRAPRAFPGSTDTATFPSYVEPALGPALHQGHVTVLDHLKPHLTAGVAAAIERAGARLLPRPPSSPDDTPIEEMFSKVKPWLRRAGARAKAELDEALGEALRRVTPEDIRGWFRHAGLCATHG